MTKRLGIIGYPVGHSISPAIQQAALDYYSLDVRYEAWETPPEALEERVACLRSGEYLGANVTIPHKEAALSLLDAVEEGAGLVGAVNTVVCQEGRLKGYNTDTVGFLRALEEDACFDPSDKTVLLLGAGGAARAVATALGGRGIAALFIANRSMERARHLVEHVAPLVPQVTWLALTEEAVKPVAPSCDLVVNCTSLGMKGGPGETESPLPPELIPPGALVYDLVYNPLETPLLKAAQAAGASTLGGLPMLVYQGAAAFELWTGNKAPVAVMRQAAQRALAEQHS